MAQESAGVAFEFVDPRKLEFSFYAFLKFQVYAGLSRHKQAGGAFNPEAVTSKIISSRRVHRLMEEAADQFTDFFDLSSYFVRTRLHNLNHGTALIESGRGLRNSVAYRWNESVDPSTLQSFQRLQALLGPRLGLSLDVFRLVEAFQDAQFSRDQFLSLFRARRDQLVERKWYKLATRVPSTSMQFTVFLLGRLQELLTAGLVEPTPNGACRVTAKGREVYHWFELFLYSAGYEGAPRASPMTSLGVPA